MKTTKEVVDLLKQEVKAAKRCLREAKRDNSFVEATELQHGIDTCEFLLRFIRGECD